ncbi:unnamed protein product [Ambrosiozyma monospora]|uniref:Unnamed protein product n=1 Tax=Ambrosiozyma monospora TaxID=43982 RepID=A0ACB5TMT5_AMBMO|nr:unnamed protein product [Ambrosiozyma monospora]
MSKRRQDDQLTPSAYPAHLMGVKLPQQKKQKSDPINERIKLVESNNESHSQGPLDPLFGQRRAFPIAIDLNSVDQSKTPQDVNEYLALVRLEAQGFDSQFISQNDDSNDDGGIYWIPSNDNGEGQNDCESEERIFLEEYRNNRERYNDFRNNLTELDAIDLPKTQKEWKQFIFENQPTDELIAQIIEENEVIKLIVYFTKWLNTKVNENFASWIFRILESIDDVLDGSDLSVIRALGKKAKKQSGNDLDEINSTIMKRILFAIAGYYGQRDLIME